MIQFYREQGDRSLPLTQWAYAVLPHDIEIVLRPQITVTSLYPLSGKCGWFTRLWIRAKKIKMGHVARPCHFGERCVAVRLGLAMFNLRTKQTRSLAECTKQCWNCVGRPVCQNMTYVNLLPKNILLSCYCTEMKTVKESYYCRRAKLLSRKAGGTKQKNIYTENKLDKIVRRFTDRLVLC